MNAREKRDGFSGQRVVALPAPVVASSLQHGLLKNLMPTSMGYFPQAKGHLRIRDAGAEQYIFIYCARGSGWCEMEGQRHAVGENDLVILPPGVPHAYGADENQPWSIHWLHAVGHTMPAYLNAFETSTKRPVVRLDSTMQVVSHFEEALEALERGFTLPQLLYAAHALIHLLGLMLWYKDTFRQGETTCHERIAKTIEFMKNHLDESLRVSNLAVLAGFSPSRYRTLFKQDTNHSPIEYLNRLRMQQAVQLLSTTSLPIKIISTRLGWPDQQYFSRLFRSFYGHSPSEHRLLHETVSSQPADKSV